MWHFQPQLAHMCVTLSVHLPLSERTDFLLSINDLKRFCFVVFDAAVVA